MSQMGFFPRPGIDFPDTAEHMFSNKTLVSRIGFQRVDPQSNVGAGGTHSTLVVYSKHKCISLTQMRG